jgi:hypothetical protein
VTSGTVGDSEVRLVVAEPIRMIAQTRCAALEAVGVDVVGIAATKTQLVRLIREEAPSHILLGASEPGDLTPLDRRLVERVRRLDPEVVIASIVHLDEISIAVIDDEVLLLSVDMEAEDVADALRGRCAPRGANDHEGRDDPVVRLRSR